MVSSKKAGSLKLLGILMLIVIMALTAACGTKKATQEEQKGQAGNQPSQQQQASKGPRVNPSWQIPTTRKSLPGAKKSEDVKWVKWNPEAGKFEPVQGPGKVTDWQPQIRKASKAFKVGLTNQNETTTIGKYTGDSCQQRAKEAGLEFIRLDNRFPDSQQPLTNADILVSKKADLVLDFNALLPLVSAIQEKYNKAKIPVISIDTFHEGALFFGADNYTSGWIAGEAAAKYIKEQNIPVDQLYVVVTFDPEFGEVPMQRQMAFRDALLQAFPELDVNKVFEIPGGGNTEKAMESMAAWLGAHPEAKYITGSGVNDPEVIGMAAAVTNAGRAKNAILIGIGGDESAIAELRKPESALKATVGYFFEKYGDYLIGMALDILEGKPVPEEVHMKHAIIDKNNVNQYYPAK